MADQTFIQLTPEAQATLKAIDRLPGEILSAIASALDYENGLTVGHIQRDYLSFGKGEPPTPIGCRVQSNRLRPSLRATPAVIIGERVESYIGSNVKYAAVQEFGFEGDQHIPAHTREVSSRDVYGKVDGKRRKLAKGVGFVKEFTRHVNIGERAFTRRGIADRAVNYTESISRAIISGWEAGK